MVQGTSDHELMMIDDGTMAQEIFMVIEVEVEDTRTQAWQLREKQKK